LEFAFQGPAPAWLQSYLRRPELTVMMELVRSPKPEDKETRAAETCQPASLVGSGFVRSSLAASARDYRLFAQWRLPRDRELQKRAEATLKSAPQPLSDF
jgi:hypothetical protein